MESDLAGVKISFQRVCVGEAIQVQSFIPLRWPFFCCFLAEKQPPLQVAVSTTQTATSGSPRYRSLCFNNFSSGRKLLEVASGKFLSAAQEVASSTKFIGAFFLYSADLNDENCYFTWFSPLSGCTVFVSFFCHTESHRSAKPWQKIINMHSNTCVTKNQNLTQAAQLQFSVSKKAQNPVLQNAVSEKV